MSFDKLQFKMMVLDALELMEEEIPVSDAALNLVVGTAAQESHYGKYLRQLDDGPALGVFQMEPATHDDIWDNFIQHRPALQAAVTEACQLYDEIKAGRMVYDLRYAAIMCRIHYYRVPAPLPAWDDVEGLAHYWKDHYNTHLGAGTVSEFVENYERYTP